MNGRKVVAPAANQRMKLTGTAILVSRGTKASQAAPAAYPFRSAKEGYRVVERYRLERGGVVLGIVTLGEWDGQQGSWHNWGCLEPPGGSDAAIELLSTECRMHDEAMQLELAGGDPTGPLHEATRLQAEFMAPGVALVSLADGTRSAVDEMHTEAERIYWR
jgi:hypothetical protein